jgi:hypothetical protein
VSLTASSSPPSVSLNTITPTRVQTADAAPRLIDHSGRGRAGGVLLTGEQLTTILLSQATRYPGHRCTGATHPGAEAQRPFRVSLTQTQTIVTWASGSNGAILSGLR